MDPSEMVLVPPKYEEALTKNLSIEREVNALTSI